MSRTTYGYLAFKLPCGDLTDAEVVAAHEKVVADMVAIVEAAGGSLSTLAEVANRRASDGDSIKEESIRKAADNAKH